MKKHFPVLLTFLVLGLGFISFGLVNKNTRTSLPASSIESQIDAPSKTLYLMGGGERPELNSVISTTNGTHWNVLSSSAPFPSRINQTFLPWKNGFVMFGGYGYNNGTFNFNDVWSSPDGANWAQILEHAPWQARSGNAGLVYNNMMYLIGGETYNASGSTFYNDVWRSVNGVHWVKEENAPWSPRSIGKAIVFKNKLWVIGGGTYNISEDGTYTFEIYKDIWSYDGTTWVKELDQAPWDAVGPEALFVLGDTMYVIADDGLRSNTSVWSTADGVHWEFITDAPNFPHYNFTSFAWNGKMYLAGGTKDEESYSGLWSSTDGINWQDEVVELPFFKGEGHAAVVR